MRVFVRAILVLQVVLVTSHCFAENSVSNPRVIHVIVALADNHFQGIVPVPASLGNGDDADHNLYWGAGGGVRGFFQRSPAWERVGKCTHREYPLIERCVFRHKTHSAILVADAYRGREIKRAIDDFFAYSAGRLPEQIQVDEISLRAGGGSNLVAYVGHDGLMDFSLTHFEVPSRNKPRQVIVLACASKQYFASGLRRTGAEPLLWTTNLMAPEAYTLEAALNGWLTNESGEQVRERAAAAYDKYQHCGMKGARKLFATGW